MLKDKEIGKHIVAQSLTHMKFNQNKIAEEQNSLLSLISGFNEIDSKELTQKVIELLKKEKESIEYLNQIIKTERVENGHIPHFGIRTHKILEIIEALESIVTEDSISSILKGELPDGYDNTIKGLPILGEENAFWGTSKVTFLTSLLKFTHFAITENSLENTEESIIFHEFAFPEGFNSDSVKESIFISKDSGLKLKIPHSGYSFGGDRSNTKELRPNDCTSFLEMVVQLPKSGGSSVDLYLTKRYLSEEGLIIVDESWLETNGGKTTKLFDLNTGSPKSGDIWVCRNFNEEKAKEVSFGCSGHAGIYIGEKDGEILLLAYNRDMPEIEGFGIQHVPVQENSDSIESFFLTRNEKDFDSSDDVDLSVLGSFDFGE